MDFSTRFAALNASQRAAVEKIDGPLLVVAGPGTGKTELLSMRAANILRQTDTLASSILCLTFTESGATNMRERLRQIIGEDAYRIAIHTFHSFGVEIINQHREYFFRGSEFRPADELSQYQILKKLFEELDHSSPLATKNQDEYIYLPTLTQMISEFKKSGLSSDELRQLFHDNQRQLEQLNLKVKEIFADRITKQTIADFASLAQVAAELTSELKLPSISPYHEIIAPSIARATSEAIDSGKTSPITAWKNEWCAKDAHKQTILRDLLQLDKLFTSLDIYDRYREELERAKLFDYDDMILSVIQSLDKHPELKASLNEKFQYVMVDEFQDTNLAQLRLLFALTDYEDPNIMAVGDDDQAIFSFQGADIGNIQRFRSHFSDLEIIVLTDNYRSSAEILSASRSVITLGTERLERTIEGLSKELTPRFEPSSTTVSISEHRSAGDERATVVQQVSKLIASGTPAESIAILAKQHNELIDILPHLTRAGLRVSYERRDSALDHELIGLIEKLSRIVVAMGSSDHQTANTLLPEILAHPAFGFTSQDIWKLSLSAWRERSLWLERMISDPVFADFANWLISLSHSTNLSLEETIDELIGSHPASPEAESINYRSPLFNYFFSDSMINDRPDAYLSALESLRTIRDATREHFDTETPGLIEFLAFIDMHREMKRGLTTIRHRADQQAGLVNLMTVHKSKGLEFEHVFVIGATDSAWGEKARGRSRNISYPRNLPLEPSGSSYDERLRLFFVAMTRAKQGLYISHPLATNAGKPLMIASFLSEHPVSPASKVQTIEQATEVAEIDWRGRLASPITGSLRDILLPDLTNYKLSATHLNNFIDVSRGGPRDFLLNNLLRFPQAKSPHAIYGTAVHAALQFAHNQVRINGSLPTTESILEEFDSSLAKGTLSEQEMIKFSSQGHQAIKRYISEKADSFRPSQLTELNFASQGVVIGEARLTGSLDLADIDRQTRTIRITDYKTGKPSSRWQGRDDREKIKLHKYRQQLMFYQLLAENSRDYANYQFFGGVLQFVEADKGTDELYCLEDTFSDDELSRFRRLIEAIWQHITKLDLPDVTPYSQDYKGVLAFEEDLLAEQA